MYRGADMALPVSVPVGFVVEPAVASREAVPAAVDVVLAPEHPDSISCEKNRLIVEHSDYTW